MYVWVTENLAIEQQLKVEAEKCQLELKQAGGFQLNTLTARVHLFCQTEVLKSTFSTQLRIHQLSATYLANSAQAYISMPTCPYQ